MENLECKIMFIFPGQGSQYAGMGSDIHQQYAVARSIYERAGNTLGFDIAALSFHDPENKLDLTRYTQVALLTHSIACLEVFRELTDGRVQADIAAGHSLGEYCALVASGALSFETALRLVQKRGELMSEYGRGKMLALPMDRDTVKSFIDQFYCGIGGCNLPEQTVVGGREEDLQAVADFVSSEHRKRSTMLNTEGAFHTYLMIKAAEAYRPFLNEADMTAPEIQVLANYSGTYHDPDPAKIKAMLFFQLFNPVRWTTCMQTAIEDGVHTIIEFGGGIGKGDSPAERRPNLMGITTRIAKAHNVYIRYLPAINLATIDRASHVGTGVDDNWFYLLLPEAEGSLTPEAETLLKQVETLDLTPLVQIIREPAAANLRSLQKVDPNIKNAQPCLMVVVGAETDAILTYYREDIAERLQELRQHLENSGYHYLSPA